MPHLVLGARFEQIQLKEGQEMRMRGTFALFIGVTIVAGRSALASPYFTIPASGNEYTPNVFLQVGNSDLYAVGSGTNPTTGSADGSVGSTGATGSTSFNEQWTQPSTESMDFTASAAGLLTANLSSADEISQDVEFEGFGFVLDSTTDVSITGSLDQYVENDRTGQGGGANAESIYISGPGLNIPYQRSLMNSTPGPTSLVLDDGLTLDPGSYTILIYEQNNWSPLSTATGNGTIGGSGGFNVTIDLPEPSPLVLFALCGLLASTRGLRLLRPPA
jgi:hypothetical protein